MPIRVPGTGDPRTLVFGRGSHIKLAEQITPGIKITDPEAFSKYKVAVNSMTIAPTSTLLTPGVIPTTVEQFEGVPGPLTIAGNFVIDALPLRQELFFRQLLNAPSTGEGLKDVSTSTIAPGSHVGTGTAQTIAGTTTSAATTPVTFTQINPNQGPIQLVFLGSTLGVTGGTLSATNPIRFTITGTDYRGSLLSESLDLTSARDTKTTTNYFHSINTGGIVITTPGVATAATGNFGITGTSTRRAIQIQSTPGYRITPGVTMEIVSGTQDSSQRGGTVNSITDAYLNTFAFSATREEIVTYTFGVIGKLFEPNINPASGMAPFADDSRTSSATGPYGDGPFATIQDDNAPYAGYSGLLRADDGSTPVIFNQVTGISMTFDNNTLFTDRLGSIYPGVVYNRQRTANVELTLEYHSSDTDFARAYLEADEWTDVELSLISSGGVGSFPTQETRFKFPKFQLSEYPTTPIESDDFVRQTIRGIAIPTSGSATDAVTVWTYGDDMHTVSSLDLASLS